ncbi:alpha/beta hydrolase [Sphingopyxis sp. QXT-31]|uniref:alpha/beta fold hydrolase n=1 Tax=Sphingopyxis sp. QXT-31 TaxID=1357916 RepID=UPI0009797BD5|nr:alpha/beta hydrolase [Sphingopyxis sp. QXT-31]AQA01050.1 alpha/beta hydrolase [Sphingopyxis sp. QXT-31]
MIGDFEQQRVKLSTGVELDVVDIGPRDAPVLIFLHGFPESHRTWRHQLPHFAGRFRCIAPDQRGYCGSSKPQDVAEYTPDKLFADVFALADALGIETFTIVGHDWGGAISWGVALGGQPGGLHPAWAGRVTRAVIANAPHPGIFGRLLHADPTQRAASQYIRMFRDPATDALVREQGLAGVLAKAFEGRLEGMPTPPEEVARSLAWWENRDTCFGMLNWYRASPMEVPPMDAPFVEPPAMPFPKLEIPTLVIWALDDVALPPSNLDGLEELVPNATIVKVPGCGHFVTWEAPDAVNAAMEKFLAATG